MVISGAGVISTNGQFTSNGNILVTSTGNLVVANTAASTTNTTGALVVLGGVGVSGQITSGGNILVTSTGNLVVANTAASTSTATGALVVTGGVGIGGTLFGTTSNFNTINAGAVNAVNFGNTGAVFNAANITITGVTPSGSGGGLYVSSSANITVNNTAPSTSATTGAVQVTGGMGIGGNVYSSGYEFGNPAGGSGVAVPGLTGVRPAYQYYALNANVLIANGIGDQRIFGVNVFVAGGTIYEFETMFAIKRDSATAAGSGGFLQFNLGQNLTGVATINSVNYQYISGNAVPNPTGATVITSTASAANIGFGNVNSNVGITSSVFNQASVQNWAMIKGVINVGIAGWISPRINWTVAPGGVAYVQSGSYVKLAAVGWGALPAQTQANLSIGSWTV
jgi:hypothetical protein